MPAHRAETTLSEDGVITLRDIRSDAAAAASGVRYPLRGTPVKLLSPPEPVAEADWKNTL